MEQMDRKVERKAVDKPYPLPIPCLLKVDSPQPIGDASLPWLPGAQQHGEGS